MHAQTVSHGRDMHLVGEGEREEADVLEAYRLYSRELDRYPLLSPEQEQEVAVRAHRGDRQARQVLACANLRLVLQIGRFVAEQSAAVHLPSYVVEEWRVLRRGTEAEIREELLSGPVRGALTWLT